MKKMLSLTLALILCLTGVAAVSEANTQAAKSPDQWVLHLDQISIATPGFHVHDVNQASIDLVNDLLDGDIVKELFASDDVVYVDDAGNPISNPAAGKEMTEVYTGAMNSITVDEGVAPDTKAVLVIPAGSNIATYLIANQAMCFFAYKDGDTLYVYQADFEVVYQYNPAIQNGMFVVRPVIPAAVLSAAEGKPVFMSFETAE